MSTTDPQNATPTTTDMVLTMLSGGPDNMTTIGVAAAAALGVAPRGFPKLDPDVVAVAQQVASLGRATPPPPYRSPMMVAAGTTPKALAPADLAWLSRLPSDPAQITDADAARLARLHADVPVTASADRHLLEGLVTPLRALHAQRAAVVDAERMGATIPPAPTPDAVSAAKRAIARELEGQGAPADEARSLADVRVAKAVNRQRDEVGQRRAEAAAALQLAQQGPPDAA